MSDPAVDLLSLSGVRARPSCPAVTVGQQVRQLRVSAGLTQHELAARAGTTQPAIAHLESGRRVPTLGTLERLARALGQDLVVVLPCRDAAGD